MSPFEMLQQPFFCTFLAILVLFEILVKEWNVLVQLSDFKLTIIWVLIFHDF